jgi:hypothetical protein
MRYSQILMHVMPKSGFYWRTTSRVLSRTDKDNKVKKALKAGGVRFNRPGVIEALALTFEAAAAAVQTQELGDGETSDRALYRAIANCRRNTHWAAQLTDNLFADLLLSVRAARRVSLEIVGFDDTETGTWARRLATAVDHFTTAIDQRGWEGTRELRALEHHDEDGDEDEEEKREVAELAERVMKMDLYLDVEMKDGDEEIGEGMEGVEEQEQEREQEDEEDDDEVDVGEILGMDLY